NYAQFSEIIRCAIPGSHPLLTLTDYGCYCGPGGQGTPVDDLDRCCQTHDECYGTVDEMGCTSSKGPALVLYKYTCSEKTVTCDSKNYKCAMTICECDRKAAVCFAKAYPTYKNEYWNMDQSLCK
ncbi:basic phospholipase A2 pseudexin B chain-like, partial [Amblyraja radiata]|uniref:basic phospholipase A2 pseudexin B chain-like n=1 Tax=Amblyraja radiata TaxID=386614 RepID=UPI0014031132